MKKIRAIRGQGFPPQHITPLPKYPVEAFLFIENDFYCLKFVDGLSFGCNFTGNVEEATFLQFRYLFSIKAIAECPQW